MSGESAGIGPLSGRDCRCLCGGRFSLEEGLRFAAERGALMGGLPTKGKQAGGMLAVFAIGTVIALLLKGFHCR